MSSGSEELATRVRLGTGDYLVCTVCRHELFIEQPIQLHLSDSKYGAVLHNRGAKMRTCARCRFVHLFHGREHKLEADAP